VARAPLTIPYLAATVGETTRPCLREAVRLLEERGHSVWLFPADGKGGRDLEARIKAGEVAGVLDLTTAELAAAELSGPADAGRDRLTAAAERGIPQVIGLGGLDAVWFGPGDRLPPRAQAPERRTCPAGGGAVYVRTTPEENDRIGNRIAYHASAARGPTAILTSRGGLSLLDAPGEPFWWPEADRVLFESIANWSAPWVEQIDLAAHLNDPACARAAVEWLLRALG
jgi:uncharacterized protein (UPF0261 family)